MITQDFGLEQAFPPLATYRLQLNKNFTFKEVQAILPYLAQLGINMLYLSPFLAAIPSSMHGYDNISFRRINPEIGSKEDFHSLIRAARQQQVGLLFDLVANHMAASSLNHWWSTTLEFGKKSLYADFFDIEWDPPEKDLKGKILVPVLSLSLKETLKKGKVRIISSKKGLLIEAENTLLPISPEGYSLISQNFKNPEFEDCFSYYLRIRREQRKFHRWAENHLSLEKLNQDRNFLEKLVALQHYHLTSWEEAAKKINYRRFFEIKSLVGLRVEDEKVFNHVMRMPLDWAKKGYIQGFRVDHPDGFYDPDGFFSKIETPFYTIVEKILQRGEPLPSSWKVQGTVGYEFLNSLNRLFVKSANENAFDKIYARFGKQQPAQELLQHAKKQFLLTYMRGELAILSKHFYEKNSSFSDEELQTALAELIASFPIYRTYIRDKISQRDKSYLEQTFGMLKRKSPAMDFLHRCLFLEEEKKEAVMCFQQLTPAIFAKGFEDTFLYLYNRLISLNEVGGDPTVFGITVDEFHEQNRDRHKKWPFGMAASSTHDTKRSEDVRYRLNVLSEMPKEWDLFLNAVKKDARLDPNELYFFYQTLLGVFPFDLPQDEEKELLSQRLKETMVKAAREAKANTNWYYPQEVYEKAWMEYIDALFAEEYQSPFWKSFLDLHKKVSYYGMLNSLSALILKIGSPGVTDTYQGSELWDFSMVDPDNRRPVDFQLRKKWLSEMEEEDPQKMLKDYPSGKIKLYLLRKGLQLKKEHPELFLQGEYRPLKIEGPCKEHCVAFFREHKGRRLLVAASRFHYTLSKGRMYDPHVWKETKIAGIEIQGGLLKNLLNPLPAALDFF